MSPPPKSSDKKGLCVLLLIPVVSGGHVYSFGIYANALKESLQLSQPELTTISSAAFCAGIVKWAPGLFIDKYGPRISMIMGGIISFILNMIYWYIATKKILTKYAVVILSMLAFCSFLSQSLVSGSTIKLLVASVPIGSRGRVVGIAKGYLGLGAGVYTILFQSLCRDSDLDLLLMSAVFFAFFAAILPAFFVYDDIGKSDDDDDDYHQDDTFTPMHFRILYVGLFGLSCLIVSKTILFLNSNDEEYFSTPQYFNIGMVFLFWAGPIVGLLFLPQTKYSRVPTFEKMEQQKQTTTNYTLWQVLQTSSAWLLLYICTILTGAGVVVTQNIGPMVIALSQHLNEKTVTPAAVAIFSVANAVSRVASGALLSLIVLHRARLLLVASVLATIAHAGLAVSTTEIFFLLSIMLAGVAYGFIWPLIIVLVGDVYGQKYLASNYLFFEGLATAGGTFLLSKVLSQAVYQNHLSLLLSGDDPSTSSMVLVCIGRGCFELTHWVTSLLCLTTFMFGLCFLCSKFIRKAYCNGLAHER